MKEKNNYICFLGLFQEQPWKGRGIFFLTPTIKIIFDSTTYILLKDVLSSDMVNPGIALIVHEIWPNGGGEGKCIDLSSPISRHLG